MDSELYQTDEPARSKAATAIQNAYRCKVAKQELAFLKDDYAEEMKWRQQLRRRRARIEQLERELQHVEELPSSEVDKFATTSRFGLRNHDAAVRTIQGAWRTKGRREQRVELRAEKRKEAAKAIQQFFRRRKEERRKRTQYKASAVSRSIEVGRREVDGGEFELLSIQRVKELQQKVTTYLESKREERSFAVPSEEQVGELQQRAKSAIANYKANRPAMLKDTHQRFELRASTASAFAALWGGDGLANLLADRGLQAGARGQERVGMEQGQEYAALVEAQGAREHRSFLQALHGSAPVAWSS